MDWFIAVFACAVLGSMAILFAVERDRMKKERTKKELDVLVDEAYEAIMEEKRLLDAVEEDLKDTFKDYFEKQKNGHTKKAV